MPARYFRSGYLSDIARLPVLDDSYFRNNADLGTGLLMANSAITSPHFFCPAPFGLDRISAIFRNWLNSCRNFRILATVRVPGFFRSTVGWRVKNASEDVHRSGISSC